MDLKKYLITVLIKQIAVVATTDVTNQPFAFECLKKIVESIAILKASEVCIITEQDDGKNTIRKFSK